MASRDDTGTGDSEETIELLRRARGGERAALDSLFERHRARLLRMVEVRLDPRLRRRIDPDDVLQETLLDATQRLPAYLERPSLPFFVWLRFLTGQKLLGLHRYHLGAQCHDADRDVELGSAGLPGASNESLADAALEDEDQTPSSAAARVELRARLRAALENLSEADREILVLRQFEQLSNAEAAAELGLKPSAASKRFLRALRRYKEILDSLQA